MNSRRQVSSICGDRRPTLYISTGASAATVPWFPAETNANHWWARSGLGRFERIEPKTRKILLGSQGFGRLSAAELLTDCVGAVLKNFCQLPQGSLANSSGAEERQSEQDPMEVGGQ
jgi:hypothetical protein